MNMRLEPIYESDWLAYEWTEITSLDDDNPVYVRGKRRMPPPVDGYHYERCDQIRDSEYKWQRVYEWVGD